VNPQFEPEAIQNGTSWLWIETRAFSCALLNNA